MRVLAFLAPLFLVLSQLATLTPRNQAQAQTSANPNQVHLKPWLPTPAEAEKSPNDLCRASNDELKAQARGVDMSVYLAQIRQIVLSNWIPLMPKEVDKPFFKHGVVKVCFNLLPGGQVEPHSMVLLGRSSDTALDRAAWGAIQTAIYPRLPDDFQGPRLTFQFSFAYNPKYLPSGGNKTIRGNSNPAGPPNMGGPLAASIGYGIKP